ncbi:hypothetical protein [Alteromonas macleodii]|nr:hypothetical protein [Alteromonas macleodii]
MSKENKNSDSLSNKIIESNSFTRQLPPTKTTAPMPKVKPVKQTKSE